MRERGGRGGVIISERSMQHVGLVRDGDKWTLWDLKGRDKETRENLLVVGLGLGRALVWVWVLDFTPVVGCKIYF